jgi:hypothetical protein
MELLLNRLQIGAAGNQLSMPQRLGAHGDMGLHVANHSLPSSFYAQWVQKVSGALVYHPPINFMFRCALLPTVRAIGLKSFSNFSVASPYKFHVYILIVRAIG